MKKIEFYAGETIQNAWKTLLKESAECLETCFGTFNGQQLLSTDTLDDAYKKVTGLTKSELDEKDRKEREEYKRREEEFLASVPSKTEEYKKAARGVIIGIRLFPFASMIYITEWNSTPHLKSAG